MWGRATIVCFDVTQISLLIAKYTKCPSYFLHLSKEPSTINTFPVQYSFKITLLYFICHYTVLFQLTFHESLAVYLNTVLYVHYINISACLTPKTETSSFCLFPVMKTRHGWICLFTIFTLSSTQSILLNQYVFTFYMCVKVVKNSWSTEKRSSRLSLLGWQPLLCYRSHKYNVLYINPWWWCTV